MWKLWDGKAKAGVAVGQKSGLIKAGQRLPGAPKKPTRSVPRDAQVAEPV